MYRYQTRRSFLFDTLLVAFGPAALMTVILTGIFSWVGNSAGVEGLPVQFILTFVALTLLAGVGSAICHYTQGPRMVKMSPAEEAAKKAEINAEMEARMQAQLHRVGPNPFNTPTTEVDPDPYW